MSRNFGLSNIYLRIGLALVVVSLLMLAAMLAGPAEFGRALANWAGYCFVSGAVLYLIGRVAQMRRSHR